MRALRCAFGPCLLAQKAHVLGMETLLERFEQDLRRRGFELIETHLSRVFLGERDVYKLKRPVDLGFVNFTEREARKHACEAEVELNRRLAPAVYLGVLCVWE